MEKKDISLRIILGALCFLAFVFIITSMIPMIKKAKIIGENIGNSSGKIAGKAVGSVQGAISAVPQGYEEGVEEGLSANDTIAEIANKIETNLNGLGKLEVLVANVDLSSYHEVGNIYKALYFIRGHAVFSVDLNKIQVTYKDTDKEKLVSIVIPRPESEITIDPAEIELIADWQQSFFNGSTGQGFESQLNSLKAIKNISEKEVENYAVLLEQASQSAIDKVNDIANALKNDTERTVTVSIQP